MWGTNLRENIRHFVRLFGLVHKNQIFTFFQDQDIHAVTYFVNDMIRSNDLHDHGKGCVSTVKRLPYDYSFYDDTLRAVSVLCTFRSSEIAFIHHTEFPARVVFQTVQHKLYDITVFPPDHMDWTAVLTSAMYARRTTIPDGIPDVMNHIAVIDSIESDIVSTLVEFHYTIFATIDNNGNAKTYAVKSEE